MLIYRKSKSAKREREREREYKKMDSRWAAEIQSELRESAGALVT